MIQIKAYIKLYEKGRKTPFQSGYRPVFRFVIDMLTSGMIELIDKSEFYPSDEGLVKISFWNSDYLGDDFEKGKVFTFGEGEKSLGEGIVYEVL